MFGPEAYRLSDDVVNSRREKFQDIVDRARQPTTANLTKDEAVELLVGYLREDWDGYATDLAHWQLFGAAVRSKWDSVGCHTVKTVTYNQEGAIKGLATWAECLRELIEETSCDPDDPDTFDEVLTCFDLALSEYRKTTGSA